MFPVYGFTVEMLMHVVLLAYLNEVKSRGDDLSLVQDHSHDCVFSPDISQYQ